MNPSRKLIRVLRSHPSLVAILFGVFIAALMLVFVELGVRVYKASSWYKPPRASSFEGTYATTAFFHYDKNLGYIPKPNVTVESIRKYNDGEVIYRALYSTDREGRRITPVDSPQARKRFALFFGCSFTFGEGVAADETLPHFVGKLARCYTPYNYGFSGYGPQQMLAKLQSRTLTGEIRGDSGVALCFSGDVNRVIGSMYVYNGWAKDFPYYFLDGNGDLVRNGSFTTGRPLLSFFYRHLGTTRLASALKARHPYTITDDHIKLTARVIEESSKLFKRQFNSDAFYFVQFPEAKNPIAVKLLAFLKAAGVKVLDYSDRKEFSAKGFRIEGDGHPTAKWNEELAKLVVGDLRLNDATCDARSSGPQPEASAGSDAGTSLP